MLSSIAWLFLAASESHVVDPQMKEIFEGEIHKNTSIKNMMNSVSSDNELLYYNSLLEKKSDILEKSLDKIDFKLLQSLFFKKLRSYGPRKEKEE